MEKLNKMDFKKESNNIVDDVEEISQKSITTRSEEKMVKILSMLTEITKCRDTTDLLELQSEQSVVQDQKAKRTRIKNTYTKSKA